MIEEKGVVVKVDEKGVWVETRRKSTCSGCQAKAGCGQHLADKYLSKNKKGFICAASEWQLSEGDQVLVAIPERALLMASALVYLLPLGLLMVAIALSAIFRLSDFYTVSICVVGLVSGFMLLNIVNRSASDICDVRVVGVIPESFGATRQGMIRST